MKTSLSIAFLTLLVICEVRFYDSKTITKGKSPYAIRQWSFRNDIKTGLELSAAISSHIHSEINTGDGSFARVPDSSECLNITLKHSTAGRDPNFTDAKLVERFSAASKRDSSWLKIYVLDCESLRGNTETGSTGLSSSFSETDLISIEHISNLVAKSNQRIRPGAQSMMDSLKNAMANAEETAAPTLSIDSVPASMTHQTRLRNELLTYITSCENIIPMNLDTDRFESSMRLVGEMRLRYLTDLRKLLDMVIPPMRTKRPQEPQPLERNDTFRPFDFSNEESQNE